MGSFSALTVNEATPIGQFIIAYSCRPRLGACPWSGEYDQDSNVLYPLQAPTLIQNVPLQDILYTPVYVSCVCVCFLVVLFVLRVPNPSSNAPLPAICIFLCVRLSVWMPGLGFGKWSYKFVEWSSRMSQWKMHRELFSSSTSTRQLSKTSGVHFFFAWLYLFHETYEKLLFSTAVSVGHTLPRMRIWTLPNISVRVSWVVSGNVRCTSISPDDDVPV